MFVHLQGENEKAFVLGVLREPTRVEQARAEAQAHDTQACNTVALRKCFNCTSANVSCSL